MRKVNLYIVTFLILAFAVSCGEEEGMDVTINFRLTYDGEPLVMTHDYVYPDGKTIRFNRFSFFVSEVTLNDGDRSIVAREVDFLELTRSHLDVNSARKGFAYELGSHSLKSIKDISFNIGLTEDQNKTVPADYVSGDVLARPGEYWLAWDSFIFFKIEGFIDLDGDNDPETNVALHVGSDLSMRHVGLSTNDIDGSISIVIDVKDIFERGQLYTIAENPQIHSLSQLPFATFLAENFRQTLKIE